MNAKPSPPRNPPDPADFRIPAWPQVDYRAAAKVLSITKAFGLTIICHADMPPNQAHMVSAGRRVATIILED